LRLIVDTIEYGTEHLPKWNTISISGYHIREAGSTAVQELAFTLADGLTYVDESMNRGLAIDSFAPRLSFFFNAHNDFFEEICKYRAARRIWAREMKKRGAKDPRSMRLRFHTQTAGVTLTAQQPENNIIRVSLQGLAAVLGGTQSLHTNSFDEALALPTEKAVLMALRTQQIIANESGITNTIDPLGGSYYIEDLTNRMEEETYRIFAKIEKMGGVVAGIKRGWFQKEIAISAYRYQQEIEKGNRRIVGVNCFRLEDDAENRLKTLEIDPEVERNQKDRLARLRRERDNSLVEETLDALEEGARSSGNIMPYLLDAARSYATLGEIRERMVKVFGTFQQPEPF
jgi:methylmalonyl-CoA mutase N-terminal domain/subunit